MTIGRVSRPALRMGATTACVLCSMMFSCLGARAADRLLFGFEKDELARILAESGGKKKSPEVIAAYAKKQIRELAPDRLNATLPGLGGGASLTIRKGDATEGEWSLAYGGARNESSSFAPGAYRPIFNYRSSKGGSQGQDVLDMCGTSCNLPGGTDWTGFARLLLDVRCGADAVIRLGIEDAEIMPPVERTFRVPAGKWVTVEVDLDKAREARGLDLSKMINYYVFLNEMDGAGALLLDNLRLASKGSAPALPVVSDESAYAVEPRNYAIMQFPEMKGRTEMNYGEVFEARSKLRGQWKELEFPADESPPEKAKPDSGAGKGPWRVDVVTADGKSGKQGWKDGMTFVRWGILEPVAYDARRIAVPLVVDYLVHVFCTTNGGVTWGPAARPVAEWPALAGNPNSALAGYRQDGCGGGACVSGDETYLLSNAGCCSWNWHSDRLFFNRIELTGDGWRVTPLAPVDGDLRHCTVAPAVIRLASGRLWAAYDQYSRFRRCGVAAMFSDDGGASWRSWREGKHAQLPGSLAVATGDGYGGDRVSLFPYGDNVGCVMCSPSNGKACMWLYDGNAWGEMAAVPGLKSGVMTALSPDGKSVLINTIGAGGGVYRYADGKCATEQVKGYASPRTDGRPTSYGFLSQCGESVLLFGAAEFGNTRRGNMLPECRKILCWKRDSDGTWGEPVEMAGEDEPILSFSCTRFATDSGVVLAWTCDNVGWVKVKLVTP